MPGSAIASLDRVRSIQLIVRGTRTLEEVRTVAADTASLSSSAYAQILFRKFVGTSPGFLPIAADPIAMLEAADAALLIGDPALLALEARGHIEEIAGSCQWFDLGPRMEGPHRPSLDRRGVGGTAGGHPGYRAS